MPSESPTTWILTGSPENYAATRDHDFTVIGIKERNRARALQMEPGDRIVLYLTKIMCFAASVRIVGELYEQRTKIWPGKPGNPDAYPWRFATEPELVLDEQAWLPAQELVDDLEHIGKWPREHWKLAFQGQLRPISPSDSDLLAARMQARAGVRA